MKKKLFRDEYLVNPNCTHYEIDPDDTPVPDEYDNYGCDCDIHSPPPPAKVVYPRPVNPYYRGPAPFINAPFVFPAPPPPPHACRHPMPPPPPPMPRCERKPIEPDIEDPVMGEYLKPEKHYVQWLIKQLELYPRLNDSCVVQGLWTFCKDLHIRNPHACINAPAKWNQDRLESSVVFTDHCDKELGRITLYKLKSGETGLELSIGDGKSLGLRDIEDGVISHAPTPEDIDPNEIATVGWVRDALLDLLQEITDSEPTEGSDKFVNSGDIYTWVTNLFQRKLTFDDTPTDGSTNPVTSDGIYDAIEAIKVILDPTVTKNSQNGVTSAGIYDFVIDAISGIDSSGFTLPIATKSRLGGIKVGNYLKITNAGVLSVDFEAISSALSGNSTSAGGDSWKVFYYDSWAAENNRNLAVAAINAALASGYWVCAYNSTGWVGWSGCSGGGSGGTRVYVWLYAPGVAISAMDAAAIEYDRKYPNGPSGSASSGSGNQQHSSDPVYEGMTESNAVHPPYEGLGINW